MPKLTTTPRPTWRSLALVLVAAAAFSSPCSAASAQNLSNTLFATVVSNLAESAKLSWELGTRSQALLELNAPAYSVLTSSAKLPPSSSLSSSANASLAPVLSIAQAIVANRSTSNGGVTGPQALINDSAAGDPASIGMAVLLANWTGQGKADGLDYAGAATDQLNWLYSPSVPKTADGAISHRTDQLQLWSDSVYMVPPFLAYYGALTGNQTLLTEAYTQVSLYRSYLQDTNASAHGVWHHVVLGQGADYGHWSTGNAWAAAGMLRVLGTIQNSAFAKPLAAQQTDLAHWAGEVLGGMYALLDATAVFKNYPDQDLAPADAAAGVGGNFYDAAGTALLASAAYRLSLLAGVHTYTAHAEASRTALFATAANSTQQHFTAGGWLTPVVNPNQYTFELDQSGGAGSPESAAFVVELDAAWRDWVAAGSKGANGSARGVGIPEVGLWIGAGAGVVGWWVFGL
ncbi:hypothetical protein FIBSPDRAFT_865964 [Athelia psychrophila]|uniref:Glycoside hydrolase family 105 protein n=1 Tax=Athelia psychrophila TaxID=1759441 RepID=A0A166F5H1_9AGAM|nr:hypothetical protein FIBSPDRAFT_865964 [Fibularhizoctonia sp. CBS 109695]